VEASLHPAFNSRFNVCLCCYAYATITVALMWAHMKNKRRVIIFIIIIVIVVGIGVATALILSNSAKPKSSTSTSEQSNTSQQQVTQTTNSAAKQAYSGDVNGGVQQLNDAIKNTNDTHQKFVYYSNIATILFNNKDYTGALDAATKAFAIEQTSDMAAFIGQIERAKGDNQSSITYYNKAIQLIDPNNNPTAKNDKAYYTLMITQMGGKVQ